MARFPKYVSVAEKKAKNKRKIASLKKKDSSITPIVIPGRKIAKTWWGASWNSNLEIYADYSNRLTRGRSYVRQGAIADLKIDQGIVNALVVGSKRKPYCVTIEIKPLIKEKYNTLVEKLKGRLSSLEELIQGKFPKDLETLFLEKENNLFPTEDEIILQCDCPDHAIMCKHVVATLYGIGAKFDEDPLLFFKLRTIDVEDLISHTIEKQSKELIEKSASPSDRVLETDAMMDMFEIDFDD